MRSTSSRVVTGQPATAVRALITALGMAVAGPAQQIAVEPNEPRSDTQKAWKLPADERAAVEALGEALIDALNAPAEADRLRLIHRTYDEKAVAEVGVERIAGQLKTLAENFPGLVFERAELTEHRLGERISRVLHVYARRPGDKRWRDLQVFVSAERPHRLQKLAFVAEVTEPIALPNGDLTDPGTVVWLGEYVDRLAREHDLSGAALIAIGERVIFERYFGYVDAKRSKPVTPESSFSLASASKMFTALGVARLVADGKLSYADSIDKFIPEFPDAERARRISIGQLLSHASGVAEYWTEETTAAVRNAGSTADLLPLVLQAGTAFEPGTQHAYSNSNFILAGVVIERVTRKSFEQFVGELIFKPLGMTQTGYFESGDATRGIAEALGREGEGWKAHPRGRRGTAAGGCFTTARDMLKFMRGLKAGQIVPPEHANQMVMSKVTAGVETDSDYGYGFLLQRNGQVASFGHGGIARGMNAEVRYFPSLDVTVVLLNNQDNGAYDDLRKNIVRMITGER